MNQQDADAEVVNWLHLRPNLISQAGYPTFRADAPGLALPGPSFARAADLALGTHACYSWWHQSEAVRARTRQQLLAADPAAPWALLPPPADEPYPLDYVVESNRQAARWSLLDQYGEDPDCFRRAIDELPYSELFPEYARKRYEHFKGGAPPPEAIRAGGPGRPPSEQLWGKALLGYITGMYLRALYRNDFLLEVRLKGRVQQVRYQSGHIWGSPEVRGPHGLNLIDVMVVGKCLGREEAASRRNFHWQGPSTDELLRALREVGFRDHHTWYVVNLVRHEPLDRGGDIGADLLKDGLPLLQLELRLLRPRYVLCLGAEALAAVTGAKRGIREALGTSVPVSFSTWLGAPRPDLPAAVAEKVALWQGACQEALGQGQPLPDFPELGKYGQRLFEWQRTLEQQAQEPVRQHTTTVVPCMHPAAVCHHPEWKPELLKGLRVLYQLREGAANFNPEADACYELFRTDAEVEAWAQRPDVQAADLLGVDTEFHGLYPHEPGSGLCSIQVSWAHGKACSILLNAPFDERTSRDRLVQHTVVRLARKELPARQTASLPADPESLRPEERPEEVDSFETLRPLVSLECARRVLTPLLASKRLAMHYAPADLTWLEAYGFGNLRDAFVPPEDDPLPTGGAPWVQGWMKTARQGGIDTMLAAHAVEETQDLDLKSLCLSLTTLGKYDVELKQAIDAYVHKRSAEARAAWKLFKQCERRHEEKVAAALAGGLPLPEPFVYTDWRGDEDGFKKGQLMGYGPIDRDILGIYGAKDADGQRRLAVLLCLGTPERAAYLDIDRYGNNSREPYWRTLKAMPAFYEMRTTGVLVNKVVAGNLRLAYEDLTQRNLAAFRSAIDFPTFNPESLYHRQYALFGAHHVARYDKKTGERSWEVPRFCIVEGEHGDEPFPPAPPAQPPPQPWVEGVHYYCPQTLGLTPYKTSGKRPQLWEDVIGKREEAVTSPSTDKESLTALGVRDARAWKLRSVRYLSHVCKTVLRPPEEIGGHPVDAEDEETSDLEQMDYQEGLLSYICKEDGRVHTNFSQTKETGRASSWEPALMNLGKKREGDWFKLFREGGREADYRPLRSILEPRPGYAFVEADYTGAELDGMAGQAQDKAMMDHCRRMKLDEDDPEHMDIHSGVAIEAFHLRMPDGSAVHPSKRGLKAYAKAVGDPSKLRLRDSAKPCVVAGTRLLTNRGLVRIEELCAGLDDGAAREAPSGWFVFGESGKQPLQGHYCSGLKECVRFETEDGYQLECTREHQVRVVGPDGELVWKEAATLTVEDFVCVRFCRDEVGGGAAFPAGSFRHYGTCFYPFEQPAQVTEDWAAFFGLFVSEGYCSEDGVRIALAKGDGFAEQSVALFQRLFGERACCHEVARRRESYKDQVSCAVYSRQLVDLLTRDFGHLVPNKRLPDYVFCWPAALRATFLRWLFEGDGTVKVSNEGRRFQLGYSTSSEQLARDVLLLLGLFGIRCSLTSETRAGYDGVYWVVSPKGRLSQDRFVKEIGFVSNRKRERCVRSGDSTCDSEFLPGQENRLRLLFPLLKGVAREKCRECLRPEGQQKVRLNRSRLRLILDNLNDKKLTGAQEEARDGLRRLEELPYSYQRVRSIVATGEQRCYDVCVAGGHHTTMGQLGVHNCVFGYAYGMQAAAAQRKAKEEGADVSLEDSEKLIAALEARYPQLPIYFARARLLSQNPGWLVNCFGRYRRFYPSRDRKTQGEQSREAMNFPIQSLVADAMNEALYQLWSYPGRRDLGYWLCLQIHDAVLMEVPFAWVKEVAQVVIPACMEDSVPIPVRDLDGSYLDYPPYRLKADVQVFKAWGIPYTQEECREHGIPLKYASKA